MLAKNAFTGEYSDEVIEKWLKVFLRRFLHNNSNVRACPMDPKLGQ